MENLQEYPGTRNQNKNTVIKAHGCAEFSQGHNLDFALPQQKENYKSFPGYTHMLILIRLPFVCNGSE